MRHALYSGVTIFVTNERYELSGATMRASQILAASSHRPWPLPNAPWVMSQRWHNLLFAHWPLPPEVLRPLVPATLPLDTFEDQAWVGVVPFRMRGVRPRLLPPLPWLSSFPELNVRTYVTLDEKPGVYFFSLDASNPIAVALARAFFHLPYFRAAMGCVRDRDAIVYTSQRTPQTGERAAALRATYRPTGPVFRAAPGTLDHWLTERYCYYAPTASGHIYRCEITHAPWPLQPAELAIVSNTVAASHGIELPNTPPLLHFAGRQDILAWWPKRIT
ncbi:MAG TPA: DUF2071 domain-containing protein [Ktedonobacterales bacterium]|nr:DUF2071 domain-containing protein [Ktedonobacterales bacterium]